MPSLLVAAGLALHGAARATPPDFKSFGRAQEATVAVDERDILRIWVAYVGQGDGILIQFPAHDARAFGDRPAEPVEVLIDGGSGGYADADRMLQLLRQLYPQGEVEIEHAVITHQDQDHVLGLTRILHSADVGIAQVYHNGLASFAPGKRGFPEKGRPVQSAIFEFDARNNVIEQALGLLEAKDTLSEKFVMGELEDLRHATTEGELTGVYGQLATALVSKTQPHPVNGFHRVRERGPFITEAEATFARGMSDVSFDVLWPPAQLRKYGAGWSETVNGTSITFRLRYGDFEMLFTGDQNEFSEKALMDELTVSGRLDLLRADVLKVPHHGSKHSMPEFFRAVAPVLSVASLGPEGAKSKLISGKGAWEHPSEEVIEWLGGAHRVYLTELHERRFDWATIDSAAKLERLREHAHVVVETDGNWFRVVEVPADAGSVDIPSVSQTVRGNGTRWIRAK
ncbi:MAG TPA: hypothetical protein VG937_40280 [Polyangiaceae bacterium]|nr:hypothetical protein [Polyangiaceae bacterium]